MAAVNNSGITQIEWQIRGNVGTTWQDKLLQNANNMILTCPYTDPFDAFLMRL